LYREVTINGTLKQQLILPALYRERALTILHDDMSHLGKDKVLSLLKDRLFWPCMSKDVEYWISQCPRCMRAKTTSASRATLVNISTTQPMELVCMDYLSLETSKGGYQNILVITDHFIKYAQAIPTKNQTARTTVETLFSNYIVH